MKRIAGALFVLLIMAGALGAQTIKVTMPYSGLTYHITLSMPIHWTPTGNLPDQVRIQLRTADLTTVAKEIVNPTQNDGQYVWDIPGSVTPGQYRVRVKAIGVNVFGDSDVFTIELNPKWNLTAPADGAKWAKGQTHQITWTNHGPVPAKLNIYLVKGQTKTAIASCVADSGSYSWAIPLSQAAGQYNLELDGKDAGCNSAAFFLSGPAFTITMPSLPHVPAEKK